MTVELYPDTVPRDMELRTQGTAEPAVIRPHTRKGRLLVVDDEPQIGFTLRLLLDPHHLVVPVTSAREAMARIEADGPFDVIFCDLMMPFVGGADFYKELRASAPDMVERLVFMTGGVFSAQTNEFLESVPNACIEKPFDIGALLALINERVRSHA